MSAAPPFRTPEREARWRRDRELFDRYRRTGDPALHEAIVRRFLPLVRQLAGQYTHTSEPLDDLVQVGSLGLLNAIARFDPDRGLAFSTFAVPTIAGEIKRHFRDRTWSVRVPRSAQEAVQRVARTERELEATLRRSPTTSEIAAALGVSIEAVREARAAAHARSPELLEQPVSSGQPEGRRRIDRFQIEEAGFSAAEDAATLARLLPHLEDREREALRLRFEEDLTQTEIGMRIGCSQMHVSRLIRGAVARLTAVHEAQSQSRSAPVPGVKSAA